MSNNLGKGTIGIHGGYSPKSGEPRVLPIYQSATYKYDDPDTLEAVATAPTPPSNFVYLSSSAPTVGLEILLYKCPSAFKANKASSVSGLYYFSNIFVWRNS